MMKKIEQENSKLNKLKLDSLEVWKQTRLLHWLILHSYITGWVGVSIIRPAETEVMVSLLCLCMATRKLSDVSLGTSVTDDDVKKSNKETNDT